MLGAAALPPTAPLNRGPGPVDVTFVMPCLNEIQSLPACLAMTTEAAQVLLDRHGLRSEVLIADNGSTDGSQVLARSLGARVEPVAERGYGAALRGGLRAAKGRFLVMGDADGSYDFREAIPMIEALMDGADLCMGSRFKGGIAPGAMPWKNRYIGNPILTGVLNLLFGAGIQDAHCGLRALTRDCFDRLKLTGSGMEFASEMVIKAALTGQVIVERPATLSPDLRDRAPHLRPWRDGWRHLRYLFMLSPSRVFGVPALLAGFTGVAILTAAMWTSLVGAPVYFGNNWVVLAAAMVGGSHLATILTFATHLYGVREAYRRANPVVVTLARWVNLETMIVTGVGSGMIGLAILIAVLLGWSASGMAPADSVLPAVLGTLLVTLGAQNLLGGFLLAIVGGNQARFLEVASPPPQDTVAKSRPPRRAA